MKGIGVALRGQAGDWSIIAASLTALTMLATAALALDAWSIAYARGRVWSTLSVAARAAARCLVESGGSGPASATCVSQEASMLFRQDLDLPDVSVTRLSASVVGSDTVLVQSEVTIGLPVALPAVGDQVPVSDEVRASLVAVVPGPP